MESRRSILLSPSRIHLEGRKREREDRGRGKGTETLFGMDGMGWDAGRVD